MNLYITETIDRYVGIFIHANLREPNMLLLDKRTHADLCDYLSLCDQQQVNKLRSFTSLGRNLEIFVVDDDDTVIMPCRR